VGLAAAACWWGALAAHPRISTTLTWHADIQPLFARHCVSCHAESTVSVPLDTYERARPWVRAIREEVLERRMPVPQGRPGIDDDVDDHPLSPMERDLIVAWIDGGAPAGRPGVAPTATFWCRMHPEIRADRPGPCPRCSMELSAFTPDLTRRYGWSVRAAAPAARARAQRPRTVTLTVTDAATDVPVRDFERVHDYPVHLFVVSEDFRHFQHVHPTLGDEGRWSVPWRPPANGRYWFYGDFLPVGGAPQLLQRMIAVGTPPASRATASANNVSAKAVSVNTVGANTVGANTVGPTSHDTLVATDRTLGGTLAVPPLRTGDEHRLVIELTDPRRREPVTDLEPYLGAWGHLFVLHEGRDEALHAHPDSAATTPGGPAVAFDVLFPRAGSYVLWAQFQRRGTIHTLRFRVTVAPRV
jgi:hypothetical protein